MKPAPLLLFLTLTLTLPALAQTTPQKLNESIKAACHASAMQTMNTSDSSPVVRGVDGAILADESRGFQVFGLAGAKILEQLKAAEPSLHVVMALVLSNEINAHTMAQWATMRDGSRVSLVCVPTSFVEFVRNEDELAFFIGHEFGHAVDAACFGQHNRGDQVLCETRADEIGFKLLLRAGYSPYAAAGAFGRIEMYSGDTATGISGLFRQLASDHPITPNRIANMRRLLLAETHP